MFYIAEQELDNMNHLNAPVESLLDGILLGGLLATFCWMCYLLLSNDRNNAQLMAVLVPVTIVQGVLILFFGRLMVKRFLYIKTTLRKIRSRSL